MKKMKSIGSSALVILLTTASLVLGIPSNSMAAASCEHARCHTVGNICLPGHAISFRPDCTDDFGNYMCENQLSCDFIPPTFD